MRVPEEYRIGTGKLASTAADGNNGAFLFTFEGRDLMVIASDGLGWEHVSVSMRNRTPRWNEMCYVKDLFWNEDDVVVQFHPRKSEYVNLHEHCLHLWRPADGQLPTPPKELVGF